MTVRELMSALRAEEINTWFDLGLFIDRLKESRVVPSARFSGSFGDFMKSLADGGIAFITFFFSVDGASMECEKYVRAFKKIFGNLRLHYIAGKFDETGEVFLHADVSRCELPQLVSFSKWRLYNDFFHCKLERGDDVYNELILKFWNEVLEATEKLATYIEEHDIRLLYLINTNSNPGNVSLALALVLISEYLGIPVINNNHDFYWESGNSEIDIVVHGAPPGPRDHFFTNYHLGEVFSLLEVLYPWESRSWLQVNINHAQSERLVSLEGQNPANVYNLSTAIDFDKFYEIADEARKQDVLRQIAAICGGDGDMVPVPPIDELLENWQEWHEDMRPILIGADSQGPVNFVHNNIILLQPTRILDRKKIEVDFVLIKKLFDDEEFAMYFDENPDLKITILVTGPVAAGQMSYFHRLLREFADFTTRVNAKHKSRTLLGFLFSEYDRESYTQRRGQPMTFVDVYNIASLVMLPSETEGRGLPIIEAAACGKPIFCRRYEPEVVYSYVIGEHLPRSERLEVIEFSDPALNDHEVIEMVKRRLFSPKEYARRAEHNKEVIRSRYGFPALVHDFKSILHKLYFQINSGSEALVLAKNALQEYNSQIAVNRRYASRLLNVRNRQYLPGYGQMAFMIFLKSLIDPSYFRIEEKRIRGLAMKFAKELLEGTPDPTPLPVEVTHQFYNSVDALFLHNEGEIPIRIDHAMAYRHRNKRHYPYRDLTPQELTGVINIIYNWVASPPPAIQVTGFEKIGHDWNANLSELYDGAGLAIDHMDELEEQLRQNVPIAYFPGKQFALELELFVLHPVRLRLGLAKSEKIHARFFDRADLAPIYILKNENPLGNSVTAEVLKSFVYYSDNSELKILFEKRICRIVETSQSSVGLHFYELGKKAARALEHVKDERGFLIALGDDAAMMTDIADLDRFHIGKISSLLAEKIMGIPQGSGYVQWVPAGLRFTLAYPTPVQTGKDFGKTMKSFLYKKLCDRLGEREVLQILKRDAEEKGSPIKEVLKRLDRETQSDRDVTYNAINGIYADGLPWAGVLARINISNAGKRRRFAVVSTDGQPKTVLKFVEEFAATTGESPRVAWNGGYILNPELVGKLGIPEVFIGSPLGLIISGAKVISPPLFNKPAFVVMPDGSLRIRRVSCAQGLTIQAPDGPIFFTPESYNLDDPPDMPCFYDLQYRPEELPGNGRVLVRLAGNRIKEIVRTEDHQPVPVLPVGLTLSFPAAAFPNSWTDGQELHITMNGWEEIESAIEAGPQLLQRGEVCIDMEVEGWKTQNSINTQAARLDYTDMRGPKIAIGIDATGALSILAVNGRIRESVGATHHDMAEILKAQGIMEAMGFDPGGSATLVVDNKTLNMSPYNSQYEKDVYSLPPEPRPVSNAVIVV